MRDIKFPGRLDPITEPPLLSKRVRGGTIHAKTSATLKAVRSGEALQRVGLGDDDAVELELTGGVRIWTHAEDFMRDYGVPPSRGSSDPAIELHPTLATSPRARGEKEDLTIAGFKTFGIDIPGTIADYLASHVENGLSDGGLLAQCSTVSPAALTAASKLAGRGPTLLFLHGTASSTEGSFGALWQSPSSNRILRIDNPGARMNELFEAYGGRVLAFQHRTLTQSPVVNALALTIQLAKVLPGDAELHVVSHSRGGMIGELLARGMREDGPPFDDMDFKPFDGRPDTDLLAELGRVLQDARFRMTRFVRVACPAAGTTLASGRLDKYFSILVNAVGRIPALAGNPIYESLTSVLAAVIKERTDPKSLPGLEAMMPDSPLIRVLNRKNVVTAADLHVLGGDLAVRGFWSALQAIATDFFYLEDHDLVVHTRSMLGGATRKGDVKYWIDTGGTVTHFNYFENSDTAARLTGALLGKNGGEFRQLAVTPPSVGPDDYQKRAAEIQPPLLLFPDFLGTHLPAERWIWADPAAIAREGLSALESGKSLDAGPLLGVYRNIVTGLKHEHQVVPVAYDWRPSVKSVADTLKKYIRQVLKRANDLNQPVRVLAHGAGGLLLRALLDDKDEGPRSIRARLFAHPDSRVVFLGMPTRGSYNAVAMLTGRSSFLNGLALLAVPDSAADIHSLFSGFDGLLELLPDGDQATADGGGDSRTGDWFDAKWWDAVADVEIAATHRSPGSGGRSPKRGPHEWSKPEAGKLAHARDVRRWLADIPLDPVRMIYVAGQDTRTLDRVAITAADVDGTARRIVLRETPDGDGLVTWARGVPDALRGSTFYAPVNHGGLVTDAAIVPALAELLKSGTTKLLSTSAPVPAVESRGARTPRPPVAEVPSIPDADQLMVQAIGGTSKLDSRPVRPKVRVRIIHGDLARADTPVLVGHYQDDVFASAEAYLDRQLNGRLRELHRMELYPGPIRTGVVVANSPEPDVRYGVHPGAVVVGLGTVGALTPGDLLATLEHGLTLFGADCVGLERRKRQRLPKSAAAASATIEAPVTALLIGSGEAGVSLNDSLQQLLKAVVRANLRLSPPDTDGASLKAFINRVDVCELYEDRAIEAVHAMHRLSRSTEIGDAFEFDGLLTPGAEGRQRASYEDQPMWWQRIRIAAKDDAATMPQAVGRSPKTSTRTLRFEAFSQQAKTDSYTVSGEGRLVDAFIQQAAATTLRDPAVGRTLFEMILPNALKEHAPDRRKLVLLVDQVAARIPWELLHDPFERGARPLAVEAGMIRQLSVTRFRERGLLALKPSALVIGNPRLKDPRFPALLGAGREARAVEQQLRRKGELQGDELTCLVDANATPLAILTELHRRQWRILHIAAHGVYRFEHEPDSKPVTGVVVGDGIYLQPSAFDQLRFVPELVFINCCHLGANAEAPSTGAPSSYPELAANVAEQFIRMGAKAVIAAGWAVDDGAAELFADTFYKHMLEDELFGDAVTKARTAVYDAFPSSNTWGAYQCYGDPAFSLRGTAAPSTPRRLVSMREVSLEADAITSCARSTDGSDAAELISRLDKLVADATPPDWLRDARVCASLGAAYGELKRFDQAVSFYEQARDAERGDASLGALEQLANLQTRYAEQEWWASRESEAPATAAATTTASTAKELTPLERLEKADALLDSLLALAKTGERLALKASVARRRAMFETKRDARVQALEVMSRWSKDSYDLRVEQKRPEPWYPLFNYVSALVAEKWLTTPSSAAPAAKIPATRQAKARTKAMAAKAAAADYGALITDNMAKLRKHRDELKPRATSMWETAFMVGMELLEAVLDSTLDPSRRIAIESKYLDMQRRGASMREIDSIASHIRFFAVLAPEDGNQAGEQTRKQLFELADAVGNFGPGYAGV